MTLAEVSVGTATGKEHMIFSQVFCGGPNYFLPFPRLTRNKVRGVMRMEGQKQQVPSY